MVHSNNMMHLSSVVSAITVLSSLSPGSYALSVTVFGGGGFAGSRVCKILADKGASVTSISKSGTIPKWCQDDEWTNQVTWKSVDLLSADDSSIDQAVGNPDAVVSCVGVIGTDPDALLKGNGDANVAAFNSAKRAGAQRAVYVSVGSEVDACKDGWLPEFFQSYFEGKIVAENAAIDAMGGDEKKVCLVKPTFI